ncbi:MULTISPECIES: hypothetical protein [Cupriavidus]
MAFRFQFYAARDAATPVFTSPWLWLLRLHLAMGARNANFGRIVDRRSGQTLEEWAQAQYPFKTVAKPGQFAAGSAWGTDTESGGALPPQRRPLPAIWRKWQQEQAA